MSYIGHTLLAISPLGTKGRDGQAGQAVLKKSIGHPLLSISPLGTNVTGWRSRTGSIKESIGHLLLSISPLGTKESYGQAGLKAVLKESIGYTLFSISLLGTNVMGWTCRKGSMKGVYRTFFTVH